MSDSSTDMSPHFHDEDSETDVGSGSEVNVKEEEEESGTENQCCLGLPLGECSHSHPFYAENLIYSPRFPGVGKDKVSYMGSHSEAVPTLQNSPTCQIPCTAEWPGQFNFELLVDGMSSSKKTWLFSIELNKIFVDVNQSIPLQFKIVNRHEGDLLFVRAMAIYNVTQYLHIPVKRCPNHLKEDEDRGLGNIQHVIQCTDKSANYEYDNLSKRFSVVVPLNHPPAGSDVSTLLYSVTCKGSCTGGMNRRPVTLIFTLERENQEVVGRRLLNIRVCSCPKRDKKKEEAEKKDIGYQSDIKKMKVMKPKPQTPSAHEPLAKKRKNLFSSSLDNSESQQVYNIQVSGTRHYIEVLKYLIMLKTYDWVETNSIEAQLMKGEYEDLLEKALKGSST